MKTPDYSSYIRASFNLVKRNKWLLIYGALAGAGGGVSLNSNFSRSLNNAKTNQNPQDILKTLPKDTAGVLGSYTSSLKDWFYSIPASKWILFALFLAILIIIGISIVLIIRNWARGSLIKGVDMAYKGEKVDLSNTSPYGFKYLRNLVLLTLRLFLVGLLLTVAAPLLWTLIFLVIKNIMILKILWVIIGILAFFVIVFIGFIFLTLINIFAERLIVLKNMDLSSAWKKAIEMSKKSLFASILMGVINKIIGLFVGLANLIVLGILIGVPAYLAVKLYSTNPAFSVFLGTVTLMSFLIFIFAASLIGAAITTFNFSNWNQLFHDYLKNTGDAGETDTLSRETLGVPKVLSIKKGGKK